MAHQAPSAVRQQRALLAVVSRRCGPATAAEVRAWLPPDAAIHGNHQFQRALWERLGTPVFNQVIASFRRELHSEGQGAAPVDVDADAVDEPEPRTEPEPMSPFAPDTNVLDRLAFARPTPSPPVRDSSPRVAVDLDAWPKQVVSGGKARPSEGEKMKTWLRRSLDTAFAAWEWQTIAHRGISVDVPATVPPPLPFWCFFDFEHAGIRESAAIALVQPEYEYHVVWRGQVLDRGDDGLLRGRADAGVCMPLAAVPRFLRPVLALPSASRQAERTREDERTLVLVGVVRGEGWRDVVAFAADHGVAILNERPRPVRFGRGHRYGVVRRIETASKEHAAHLIALGETRRPRGNTWKFIPFHSKRKLRPKRHNPGLA